MIGGHARVVQDVPPFMLIDGQSGSIVGLNTIDFGELAIQQTNSPRSRQHTVLFTVGVLGQKYWRHSKQNSLLDSRRIFILS